MRGHRDAALFQRSLIAPEVGARRGEQRNVARAAGAHFPGCVIVDRHATDHPRTHLGDGLRFRVAPRLRVRFCFGAADVDVEREHAAMAVQVSVEGVKFGEPGLARAAERGQEALVDEFQDFRTRTEVRRNHAHRVRSNEGRACLDIGCDVRSSEAIDRLLGIADHEQRAGPDGEASPVRGVRAADRVPAQPPEDFSLERIGVLELVDQHPLVAHGQRPPDVVVVSQQSECGVDEIVEVEQSGRALLSLEPLDGGAQFLDEAPQRVRSDRARERVPRVAAPDVAARRFVVHQARLRLRNADRLRGALPFPLLPERVEAARGAEQRAAQLRPEKPDKDRRSIVRGVRQGVRVRLEMSGDLDRTRAPGWRSAR